MDNLNSIFGGPQNIVEIHSVAPVRMEINQKSMILIEYLNQIYYEIEEKFMIWDSRGKYEYLTKSLKQYQEKLDKEEKICMEKS